MSTPFLAIEYRPVRTLAPYARNARTHTTAQIAQLASSIECYGFANPILVSPEGEIIAGHARVLAAQKLGMAEVPTIVLGHLNESQRRALRIADNQIALNAGWDFDMLRAELEELAKLDVDLDLLGFTNDQIQEVLAQDIALRGSDPDWVPDDEIQTVSQIGDLWQLGTHRALCGDGTQRENLDLVLAGRRCSLVFTDPPYSVAYTGKGPTKMKLQNDDLGAEFGAFLESACAAILAVAQGAIYICMSSGRLHDLHHGFTKAGGHFSTYVIWAKNTFTLARSDYQHQYEPIFYGWPKAKSRHWCGSRNQSDVWFIQKPFRNDLHPTMKPVELIERAISNSSKSGDVVLDPFGGAGSTMIACENLSRHACLVEIDPRYVDRAVQRWQKYTGRDAILAGTNKTWNEVVRERRPSSSITRGAQ